MTDTVAYLPGNQSAVYMPPPKASFTTSGDIPLPVKRLTTALDVVPWGEDNRFPQNIYKLMKSCSIGLAGLDWKARALWGNGIMPVRVKGFKDDGTTEIIEPLKTTGADGVIWKYVKHPLFTRFYHEFLNDWVWYSNCFPEAVMSKDGKEIAGWKHQESCNARYMQMDSDAKIKHVYLSQVWGLSKDQYVTFDPKKAIPGLVSNPQSILSMDQKFIAKKRALDVYDPLNDLQEYAERWQADNTYKSVILPCYYSSPNAPYYQVPAWDGSRLAGWIDIASKIPTLIGSYLNNAFHIKYHIQIPEEYFMKRFGSSAWAAMKPEEKSAKRRALLDEMDEFLKGTDKAGAAFVSYFDCDPHTGKEYNLLKIDTLKNGITIEKEMLASAGANTEILISMNINPDVLGASVPGGAYGGNKGGSNIREGKLVYDSMLHGERQLTLAPLFLTRDYNGWDEDIEFRHRDVALTTLDKGKGSEKVLS